MSQGYYKPPHRDEAGTSETRVRPLIDAVEAAIDAVRVAVMAEMDAVARRLGITRMDVVLGTELFRGEQEVESRELSAIEALFLEVHAGGFMAFWTSEEGWK